METALAIGLLCIGAAVGALIAAAWMSDKTPYSIEPTDAGRRMADEDIERLSRRLQ